MVRIDEIIDEYRKGDFDRRLYLFMEYRDMRDAFVEIDQEEYGSGNRETGGGTAKTGSGFCWRGWGFCHQ